MIYGLKYDHKTQIILRLIISIEPGCDYYTGTLLSRLKELSIRITLYNLGQVTDQLHLALAVKVTLFVFGGFWIVATLLLLVHKIRFHSRRRRLPTLEPVEVRKRADLSMQGVSFLSVVFF